MDNPSAEEQSNLLLRTKSSASSRSTASSDYDKYLQLATGKNPVMLMELDQDGTIRYLSELWETLVGPRTSDQISELIVGSEEDKFVFHRAMEMMLVNESISYTVTFNVLSNGSHQVHDDDGNAGEKKDPQLNEEKIITLEACGILLRDNATQLVTHSMWTVKPFQSVMLGEGVDSILPPDLVNRLGFCAVIFAEYLRDIEDEQILDEADLPPPRMELCRVCETFVPAWWLETHSQNCVCEHKIDSFVHLLHDNLVEQLALLQSATFSEYKSLPIDLQSPTTRMMIEQLKELCEIAININQSEMRVSLENKVSAEDILANPTMLTEANALGSYDFSPGSKWNIENVQTWKLSIKEELSHNTGLNLLVNDTIDLAKKKVDAILRLDNAMTYSLRIKNEIDNWVLQLILLQIENNKIKMQRATDFRNLESGSTAEVMTKAKGPLHEDLQLPSATAYDSIEMFDSSLKTGNQNAQSTSGTKIASPQPYRAQQREIFSPSYQMNDRITEPAFSGNQTSQRTGRSRSSNGSHSLSNTEIRSKSNSHSRSLTPRQKAPDHQPLLPSRDLSLDPKKDQDFTGSGENMDKSESSHSSLPTIVSTKPNSLTNCSILPRFKSTISLTQGRNSPLPQALTANQMSRKSSGIRLNQEKSPIVSPSALARDFLTPEQHPSLSSLPKQPLSPLLLATTQMKSTPASIKDYSVLKPISKGAYGSVYLSRKKITGEYFAIKVLKKSDMITKNQTTNVKSERAIMMVQSDKPYVAKLFASFQNKDNLFLVMEYLPGGDLATLIKMMGCLPIEWTKQYISEVIVGVDDMHQIGIIHHDLKPDNLLIDSDGHIKLTDFGLSRAGLVRRHQNVPSSARLSFSSTYGNHSSGSPSELKIGKNHHRKKSSTSTTHSNGSSFNFATRSRQNSIMEETSDIHHSTNPTKEAVSREKQREDSVSSSHSNNDISALHRSDSQMSFSYMNISRSSTPTPPVIGPFHARNSSNTSEVLADMNTPSDLALFNPDESRQDKCFFGTPDYLAPETIEGTGKDDNCDWWSVGCILFELIFGFPPFHANTPEEVFTKILSGKIEWPKFTSPEDEKSFEQSHAKDLIEKLLVVDPSKRLGSNGAQEIKDHPYFKDVDWDRVYQEEASFVPAVEHPEDTDYFDLRGAVLEDFGDDEDEDDVPTAHLPSIDAVTNFGPLLGSEESSKRTPNSLLGNYHEGNAHTPVSKLSISSVLESMSQENSNRSSPTIKHMPLAIPPHMRDRRVSKLNESQAEFGSFYFRNLSALDKANKDAINRLRNEHCAENVGVHRRTSSASYLSSSSDNSASKARNGKTSASGSPSGITFGKVMATSDSPYFRTSSPDLTTSFETAGLSRKGSGDNGAQSPASSFFMPGGDESPSGTKLKSPLSPSIATSPTSPTFGPPASSFSARTRLLSSSCHRRSSGDISAEESERLTAMSKVNSIRGRRRSGRKSSTSSDISYRMDVLVCEPIPIHRYRVTKDLESLGCTVVSVGAGDELVSRATSGVKFDLIITALKLPKLGAVDIVRLLKHTNSINATTPVVAVTNYYQEAVSGNVFDDVLEKPVAYDQLRKIAAKYTLEKVQQQEDTIVSDSDFSQ